jgi:hypothetical protein
MLWRWPGEGCTECKKDDIFGLLGSVLRTGGLPACLQPLPTAVRWLYLFACCRRRAVAVPAPRTPAWGLAQQIQCNAGCFTRWVQCGSPCCRWQWAAVKCLLRSLRARQMCGSCLNTLHSALIGAYLCGCALSHKYRGSRVMA